jgi:hypothetical protein
VLSSASTCPGLARITKVRSRCATVVGPTMTLRYDMLDHNVLFVPYFSADEAQTLDAIFRNDESAVEGMSDTVSQCLS